MKHRSKLFIAPALLAVLAVPPSFGATFSWTVDNGDIVEGVDSLSLTVDGITVTVQAFTAEINETDDEAVVVGPWPRQKSVNGAGFGIDVRGLLSEQMGLIADPSILPEANGSDFFSGGLSPGFDTGYATPPEAPSAFHFAVFTFDQPVDIPAVVVAGLVNFNRDVWMATGTSAPDFSGGFLAALAGLDVINSPEDGGDGLFTHELGAAGIRYLLVGAPPEADFGPLVAGDSGFYIDSFDATAPTLSGSVVGIDARFAACRNTTDPQTVVAPFPGFSLTASWDCEGLGLTATTGDDVVLVVRGTNFGLALSGTSARLQSGANLTCRNVTQGATVQGAVAADGSWNCVAAGLPLAGQDDVLAIIRGAAD